ncbi:hypothetical protein B0J15DRAFT_570845 [Fusarium solani]|uniref:F-box domain-containing protein n=1 Tax=Fusarium solani TaxID=169388 RepID=A0A9P9JV61_FUSSL|nr:uncharacterized protein B0J15DRAFT_570845 [Fusarium solani]KAH7234461.1 hypothetical protein B0J15DRAFT_570845 [Fusarium solani]
MHIHSTLLYLPREILSNITSYLLPPQLAQLSYTCQYLSQHVEPLLWRSIELHKPGYHAPSVEPNSAPPIRPVSFLRWSYKTMSWTAFLRASHRAEAFFTLLQRLHRYDPEQLRRLASRVKSLCAVIKPDWQPHTAETDVPEGGIIQFWQLLPFFTNLEKLELHGDIVSKSKYEQATPEITAQPLQLQVAKLFGYIPRTVENFPLSRNRSEGEGSGDEREAYEIDDNDFFTNSTIPRPLVKFLPSSRGLEFSSELTLPRLKHLHLCQPCKGSYDSYEVAWSISAQARCLSNWREILLACSNTLEVLVLEQRPSCDSEGMVMDELGEVDVIEEDDDGRRHRSLIKMVKRLFTSDRALAKVKQDALGNPTDRFPSGRFMGFLESRGIECEARQGHWFVYDHKPGFEFRKSLDGLYGTEETEDSGEFDFMCKQTPFLARV